MSASQVIERFREAYNKRDLAEMMSFLDPEIRWEVPSDATPGGTFAGSKAVASFFMEVFRCYDECLIGPGEVVVEGEAVIYAGTWVAVRAERRTIVPVAFVFALRDGKILRMREMSRVWRSLHGTPGARVSSGASEV